MQLGTQILAAYGLVMTLVRAFGVMMITRLLKLEDKTLRTHRSMSARSA